MDVLKYILKKQVTCCMISKKLGRISDNVMVPVFSLALLIFQYS